MLISFNYSCVEYRPIRNASGDILVSNDGKAVKYKVPFRGVNFVDAKDDATDEEIKEVIEKRFAYANEFKYWNLVKKVVKT